MEVDTRAWQGLDSRDRGHYGETEQQNWTGHGLDVTGKQGYYPGYPVNTGERLAYYPDHPQVLNAEMTTCDPSVYSSAQMVPMTTMSSSHGMYENLPHQHFPAGPSAEMEHWHMQMLSQTDQFIALPMRDGSSKRKRRRVISHEQRKAANIRERRRMYQLNDAFDGLRKRVPTFAYEKKLSRIETLKLAVTYIEFMADILKNNGEKCKELADEAKSRGKDSKNSSLISEDDSLSTNDDDVTSAQQSPSQSADEDELCDKSDNELEDDCKSI